MKLLYIDLFCGAGGTSTGVENARYEGRQCAKVIGCVNHDANAIASHAANHPDALHFTEDIRMLELSPLTAHIAEMRRQYPDAAELAEQEMEGFYTCWIDPKDFMPEANKNVLVKCSSGEIQTDFYAPELGGFFIEHSTHAKVTGWREMM